MRILHVIFSLLNGGKENILVDIANEQNNLGNHISVIIINDTMDDVVLRKINTKVNVITLKRNAPISNLTIWFKLFYYINFVIKPDIIHCHDLILGKLLKSITTRRMVVTLHALGLSPKQLGYYSKVFAISEIVKKEIESRSNITAIVVKNGIHFSKIRHREKNQLAGTVKLIQVSNLLHNYKGQDILVNAMDIIINKMNFNNIQLYFVGEGESRLLLEKMILEFKLQNNIFLLGGKNRDWVYYNLCTYDIFIQPSRNEGFGLTVVEAIAAKIPVISSNINGPAEILNHGAHGILFENENYFELAERIISLISSYDKFETKIMIEKAYNYSQANFDVSQTAKNYCANYN